MDGQEYSHSVRGVYFLFAFGGAALIFARGIAYWQQWQPWTVRIIGLALLALGVASAWGVVGPAFGLKALGVTAVCAAVLVWQDLWCEKAERARREPPDEP